MRCHERLTQFCGALDRVLEREVRPIEGLDRLSVVVAANRFHLLKGVAKYLATRQMTLLEDGKHPALLPLRATSDRSSRATVASSGSLISRPNVSLKCSAAITMSANSRPTFGRKVAARKRLLLGSTLRASGEVAGSNV